MIWLAYVPRWLLSNHATVYVTTPEEKYSRDTLVIPVDFSGGLEIYDTIAEQIKDLQIGVLGRLVCYQFTYGIQLRLCSILSVELVLAMEMFATFVQLINIILSLGWGGGGVVLSSK